MRSLMRLSAFLLVLGLAGQRVVTAQEEVTALLGSGPNETSLVVFSAIQAVQDRAGKPTDIIYRVVTTATAQSDLTASPSNVDFAVGSEALSTTTYNSVGAGKMMHIPFSMFSLSIFYNIPNATSIPVNMTTCLLASLMTGQLTQWTSLLTINPALQLIDKTTTPVAFLDTSSYATTMLYEYLKSPAAVAANCAVSSFSSLTGTASTNVGLSVMKTSYSFGALLTYQGKALHLQEVAMETASTKGVYVTSGTGNLTNTQAALGLMLPSSNTADFSSVQPLGMSGTNVYPMLAVGYLYVPTSQSTTGDKGALLQAFGEVLLSAEVQATISQLGLLPIGSTIASNGITALRGLTLQTTSYSIEPPGTVSASGSAVQSISATREASVTLQIAALTARIAALEATVAQSAPVILRGSGSSAVSLVVWRIMDSLTAMATTPVWMGYRAIGSGGGEAEIVGNPPGGPLAATDFGCSDVPMTSASYTLLTAASIQVVHIPMWVAPISFFVNIPASVLPSQTLRLSPCTIAHMFQGDTITTWDDPAIAADNPGVVLPKQTILPAYRTTSSGTNAVVSQYMSLVCSEWTIGSGKVLPASTGTFSVNAKGVAGSSDMTTYITNTPWSIGYADTGNGVQVGLMEVSLKNKDGNWLTSQTANVPAAASALFQGTGWPASPTADFSGVSLLNQPGATTWPITSMPFMMLRLDLTGRSDSGPLLQAFLTYLLTPTAQATLPTLGFGALPPDVLAYTVSRALPLLVPDARKQQWYFEPAAGTKYVGAGNKVFSYDKDSYIHLAAEQAAASLLSASTTTASTTSSSGSFNASSLNISDLQGISGISSRIDDTNKHVSVLQSVAIAAMCFGILALLLALFVGCRVFVVSMVGIYPGMGGAGAQSGSRMGPRSENGSMSSLPRPSVTGGNAGLIGPGNKDSAHLA